MADLILSVDTALGEVPINIIALIDDTDFKTREESVTFDQAGLDLLFNFIDKDGAFTQTAVTPTDTAGDYDWVNQGNGMYTIEIPAAAGASINNDTEGFGWFTGFATGILPWRGPVIHFAPANIVDSFVDGSDLLDISLVQIAGDAQSGTDLKDFADAGYDPATNSVEQVKVNDDVRGTDSAATATALATAQADLDIITGAAGVVIANGEITAAKFGAGAVDAAALATDAVNEIRDAMLPTQNVAFNFKYVWVAASDHVTPVTGASATSVTRSLDGGAFGAASGTLSEIANGVYRFAASAGDMNGGEVTFRFVATGGTPGAPDDAFVHITTGGGV